MLDLSLFRRPAFVGVSIGTLAIGAGMFAMFFYLSLYLQDILGYSPLQAGLRFCRSRCSCSSSRPPLGELSGASRPACCSAAALALTSLGLFLMHGIDPDSEWTTLLPG